MRLLSTSKAQRQALCLAVFLAWAGLLQGCESRLLRQQQPAGAADALSGTSTWSAQQHNAQQQHTAQVNSVLLRLRSSRVASQARSATVAAGAAQVQQHHHCGGGKAAAGAGTAPHMAHLHQHMLQQQQGVQQQHQGVQQQQQQQQASVQRSLLGFRPSADEQEAASKHAAQMSGWHAGGVTLLCFLAMALLGFMGYKALQWYERVKRPGYVELQSLDNTFFRPTFTL